MKARNKYIVCLFLLSILVYSSLVFADSPVELDIKIILASGKTGASDSRLKSLISELESVFRYSSYKLLNETSINLTLNQTRNVSLPENRTMKIISRGVSGDRVTLELEILKRNEQIFKTVIKLRNKSSITIGGPEYQGGNLLFNIFASF